MTTKCSRFQQNRQFSAAGFLPISRLELELGLAESPRVRKARPGASALPPRPAADGTRGRILLAGLALFAEHGFHGTSIRDIAAEATVQSASLYAHFPSKEAILAELVLAGHEEHHTRLVTALLEAGTDPRDRLAALVRAHVQAHTEYPMLAVVANSEMHALSPPAAAPAAALRRQSEALLAEVLAMGQQQGVFDVVHLEATAATIGGMGIQVANWYPAPEAGLNPSQLADAYVALALRLAGARRP
jgi:AcrR family transcriptional regulator